MTFREAFASWKRKVCAVTARPQLFDGGLQCKRRMGNLAFSLYLRTLKFRSELMLHRFFSCDTCMKKTKMVRDDGMG